jgi:hypothetical protein
VEFKLFLATQNFPKVAISVRRGNGGHNSKAVHHAYSKHAEVTVPSLDDWEKGWNNKTADKGHRTPATKLLSVDFRLPLVSLAQVN